jgi:hypothetical protein
MYTTADAKREAEVYGRAAFAAARALVNQWNTDDGTTPIVDLEAPARAAVAAGEVGLLWGVEGKLVQAALAAARNLPLAAARPPAERAVLAHECWIAAYEVWRGFGRL